MAGSLTLLRDATTFHCGWLDQHEPLVFVFTHTMDLSTFAASGDGTFSAHADTAAMALSSTHVLHDTLTIPVKAGDAWADTGTFVHFSIKDAAATSIDVGSLNPHVWPTALTYYYVNGDTGAAGNDGKSATAPKATIQSAIAQVGTDEAIPAVVLVAATTSSHPTGLMFSGYDAGAAEGGIALVDQVSLCGGFAPNFAERHPYPGLYASIVQSTALTGPSSAPVVATLTAGTTVHTLTPSGFWGTAVEGFTIIAPGPGATASSTVTSGAGVYVADAALTVRGNYIHSAAATAATYAVYIDASPNHQASVGGNVTGSFGTPAGDAYGVYIKDASPSVDANTFAAPLAGGALKTSYGLFIDAANAPATVHANVTTNGIHGGTGGDTSYGIYIASGTGVSISRNTIDGGQPLASGHAYGIADAATNSAVTANVINGGGGTTGVVASGLNITGPGGTYDANTISGGAGLGQGQGVTVGGGTNAKITNNLISGCGKYTVNSAAADPVFCFGALLTGGTNALLGNNTISGGSGDAATGYSVGIKHAGATGTLVYNNIVFTAMGGTPGVAGNLSICMDVADGAALSAVMNNDFFDCGGSVYTDNGNIKALTDTITIGITPNLTLAGLGNVTVDPGFVAFGADPGQPEAADVNWHIQATSDPRVRGGGFNNPCGGAYLLGGDRDGTPRLGDNTGGAGGSYSMGAYGSPSATVVVSTSCS